MDVYARPGSPIPGEQIDMAELYVPFSWYEPIWLEALRFAERGEGWKMVDDGTTDARTGRSRSTCPAACSRRNPIGASGLLRFAEAAIQVRGAAGEHQVDGARSPSRMAYGANNQYFSTWVVGRDLNPIG